jgi:peroxiredoxin
MSSFAIPNEVQTDELGLQLILPKKTLKAPEFALPSLDIKTISLSDYDGKVIVLNFWATFCAPCREEMPALQTLWTHHKSSGLVVLAVAIDQGDPDTVHNYINNIRTDFPVVIDTKNIRKQYEVQVLPTSYIIGRDGKFIAKIIGSRDWSSNSSLAYFKNLLERK